MSRPPADRDPLPGHFAATRVFPTRWADNDMYGHMNNAVYYQLFDTMINGWLATHAAVDPMESTALNLVVESGCRFFSEVGFPDDVLVGLNVARLGNSSVTYALGLFSLPRRPGTGAGSGIDADADTDADADAPTLAALGNWVHVYVDAKTRRPTPIPASVRAALTSLVREPRP
ncbi:acyl-CoA thioesterase [Streptomyces sp. S465]|uniref:acyl-CoA thioesterase n=1 Tax=Streptomyces sp. S465 TaxID=2979468 RepID=UPI0022A85FC4|nr:thioesterase family protein [Streptomyces sp. S465]WAP53754.1 thioesterase family protein [Streptomyces sp. S465]